MKRVNISLLFCLVTIYLYGQDFYMYVDGQKLSYEVSTTKLLVKSEKIDKEGIKNAAQKTFANSVKNVYELPHYLTMVDMQNVTKENIMELREQWNAREDMIYVSPVLLDDAGKEVGGFTNQIIIRLKTAADYSLLTKSVVPYQIKDIKRSEYDERSYLLTLENGATKNAMQTANELHETGLYEYAEPNLIHFLELATTDQYFTNQWGLNNTGQSSGTSGIDIRANQAWSITTGSPNIRIAILDVGVNLAHLDLVNNLDTGFDATGGTSAGAPTGNTGDFAHGTGCAGIAAAQANNTRGIAGVAYNCRIIPVRIATRSGYPLTLSWDITETQFITNGINWARVNNRADVISMSFTCLPSTDLTTAITNAVNLGRNNLGCVLVAATGNNFSTTVPYPPANSQHVIAVGAIDRKGKRANFSNYGTDLNVVAPGVDIYTTGMSGAPGYNIINNGTNDVYFSNFTGTSAACPHVAGIAALILSVRPDLSAQQVRNVIETTCNKTKLSSYTFTNNPSAHPNGAWNNEVGYGLVDAYAAVNSLIPVITGSSPICSGSSKTFSASVFPPGFYWDKSSNLSLSSTTTNPVTVSKSKLSGTGWVSIKNSNGVELTRYNLWVGEPPEHAISGIWRSDAPSVYSFRLAGSTYRYDNTSIVEWGIYGTSTLTYTMFDFTSNYDTGSYSFPSYTYGTTYWASATVVNTCGQSLYSPRQSFTVTAGVIEHEIQWSLPYPNPVSDILIIEIDQQAIAQAKANQQTITDSQPLKVDPTYDIRLYDGQGNLLRQKNTKSDKVQFNVSNLPNGIYFLHVNGGIGITPFIQQIVVEH